MSFAMLNKAAAVAALVALTLSVAHAQMKPQQARSPRSDFALLFLSRLDSGQTTLAHRMLAPNVAREIPAAKLVSAWPRRSRIPTDRRIRSETMLPLGLAYAEQLSWKRSRNGLSGAHAYWICLADVPRSGYGRITYITVVVLEYWANSKLQVSEFRSQSEPESWCK